MLWVLKTTVSMTHVLTKGLENDYDFMLKMLDRTYVMTSLTYIEQPVRHYYLLQRQQAKAHMSLNTHRHQIEYSKTCVKRPLSKRQKLVFNAKYCLMQVKSIAECPKRCILQYSWPLLSYHLSLRSLFCLFLSGRFTHVLFYLVD